jgi:hypothetical protein
MFVAGASLFSCSDKKESDALASSDLSESLKHSEGQFGKGFDEKMRADPNSEPAPVRKGDVKPVSYTAEPEPIT